MTQAQSVPLSVVPSQDAAPPFSASTRVAAGVAVLTLAGRLDAASLPVLRRAVEAALKVRTSRVVVDLNDAQLCAESAFVLRWVRSTLARQGASLTLVSAEHASLTWLHEEGHDAYRVLPTVPLAVGVAAGTAMRPQAAVLRSFAAR